MVGTFKYFEKDTKGTAHAYIATISVKAVCTIPAVLEENKRSGREFTPSDFELTRNYF
jgi:hypothetical protein